MALTRIGVLPLLLLACTAIAVVYALPCIECQACTTNNCFKYCVKSCAVGASPPPSPGVAIPDCQGFGRVAAAQVAQSACDTTLKYCEGPYATYATTAALAKVDLTQCENIAFGVCQSTANDPNNSPCGDKFGGYMECDANTFMNFYKGEVDDLCEQKVKDIAP